MARTVSALSTLLAIAALVCLPELAGSQTPSASSTMMHQSSAAPSAGSVKADMVPSLFVLNARGATVEGQTLTLSGVNPQAIVFADRPVRAAGHVKTKYLLEEWDAGGGFAKDPPNATVSVLDSAADAAHDAVFELTSPHLDGDTLTFTVRPLEGDIAGANGPASVFVDIIGLPFTPLSFAGVARRTARRAYWYSMATHYPPPAYYPPAYYPPPYYPPYPAPY